MVPTSRASLRFFGDLIATTVAEFTAGNDFSRAIGTQTHNNTFCLAKLRRFILFKNFLFYFFRFFFKQCNKEVERRLRVKIC